MTSRFTHKKRHHSTLSSYNRCTDNIRSSLCTLNSPQSIISLNGRTHVQITLTMKAINGIALRTHTPIHNSNNSPHLTFNLCKTYIFINGSSCPRRHIFRIINCFSGRSRPAFFISSGSIFTSNKFVKFTSTQARGFEPR